MGATDQHFSQMRFDFFDWEDALCMRWSVNKKCCVDWVFFGGETPVCPFGVVQELRDNFWWHKSRVETLRDSSVCHVIEHMTWKIPSQKVHPKLSNEYPFA